MGLFNRFKKKDVEAQPDNGLVEVEHAKDPNADAAMEYQQEQEDPSENEPISPLEVKLPKGNVFRVNGSYDMGKQLMLSGIVEKGTLSKGMKCKLDKGKNELGVADIKISSETVKELLVGEEGTLFLRYKSFPNIKYDTLLEFK